MLTLIENLNDLDADIVFIKNIDNVVPDRLKDETVTYKKLIAGVLVTLQKKAFLSKIRDSKQIINIYCMISCDGHHSKNL